MNQSDYTVVMSPLLANKIDEISKTISSNLLELITKIEVLSEKIDSLDKNIKTLEDTLPKDYWKTSG